MGTGGSNAGSNPAMDATHPGREGEKYMETEISSGCMDH